MTPEGPTPGEAGAEAGVESQPEPEPRGLTGQDSPRGDDPPAARKDKVIGGDRATSVGPRGDSTGAGRGLSGSGRW